MNLLAKSSLIRDFTRNKRDRIQTVHSGDSCHSLEMSNITAKTDCEHNSKEGIKNA